jgi:hypothetical protein
LSASVGRRRLSEKTGNELEQAGFDIDNPFWQNLAAHEMGMGCVAECGCLGPHPTDPTKQVNVCEHFAPTTPIADVRAGLEKFHNCPCLKKKAKCHESLMGKWEQKGGMKMPGEDPHDVEAGAGAQSRRKRRMLKARTVWEGRVNAKRTRRLRAQHKKMVYSDVNVARKRARLLRRRALSEVKAAAKKNGKMSDDEKLQMLKRKLSVHNDGLAPRLRMLTTTDTASTTYATPYSWGEYDHDNRHHANYDSFTDAGRDYMNVHVPAGYAMDHYQDSHYYDDSMYGGYSAGDSSSADDYSFGSYADAEAYISCETDYDTLCPADPFLDAESRIGDFAIPQSAQLIKQNGDGMAVTEMVEPCPDPSKLREEVHHALEMEFENQKEMWEISPAGEAARKQRKLSGSDDEYYTYEMPGYPPYPETEYNAETLALEAAMPPGGEMDASMLGERAKHVVQEILERPCLAQEAIHEMEYDITMDLMPPDILDGCHMIYEGVYDAEVDAGSVQDSKDLYHAMAEYGESTGPLPKELSATDLNEYLGACEDPAVSTPPELCTQAAHLHDNMHSHNPCAEDFKLTPEDVDMGHAAGMCEMMNPGDGSHEISQPMYMAMMGAMSPGMDPQSAVSHYMDASASNPGHLTCHEMMSPNPVDMMMQHQSGPKGPAELERQTEEARGHVEDEMHMYEFSHAQQLIAESFATHHTNGMRRKLRRRLQETERRLLTEESSSDGAQRRVLSRRQLAEVNAEVSKPRRALQALSAGDMTGHDIMQFWEEDDMTMEDIQHYAEYMHTFAEEVERQAERIQEQVYTQMNGTESAHVEHLNHRSEDEMNYLWDLHANLTTVADDLDHVVDAFQYELNEAKNKTMQDPNDGAGAFGSGNYATQTVGGANKLNNATITATFDDADWKEKAGRVTNAALGMGSEGAHESSAVCFEGFEMARSGGDDADMCNMEGGAEHDDEYYNDLYAEWDALTAHCMPDSAGCVPASCLKQQADVMEFGDAHADMVPLQDTDVTVKLHAGGRRLLIEPTLNWRRMLYMGDAISPMDERGDDLPAGTMMNSYDANMMQGVSPFDMTREQFGEKVREAADAGNKAREAGVAAMESNMRHEGSGERAMTDSDMNSVGSIFHQVKNERQGSCGPDDHCDPGMSASTIEDHVIDQMWNNLDQTHTGVIHVPIPADFDCDSLPESQLTMFEDDGAGEPVAGTVEQLDYGHICREKKHEQELLRNVHEAVDHAIECQARSHSFRMLRRRVRRHLMSSGMDVHPEVRRLAKMPNMFFDESGRRLQEYGQGAGAHNFTEYSTAEHWEGQSAHGAQYGVDPLNSDAISAGVQELMYSHGGYGDGSFAGMPEGEDYHSYDPYEYYDPPEPWNHPEEYGYDEYMPCHEAGVAVEELQMLLGFPLEEEERQMILDAKHTYEHAMDAVRANVTRGAPEIAYDNGDHYEPHEALGEMMWMMGGGDSESSHNASHAVQELACKEGSGHFYEVCCGIPTYYDIDYIHNHTEYHSDCTGGACKHAGFAALAAPNAHKGGYNAEGLPKDIDQDGHEDRDELAYCMHEAMHRYMEVDPHFESTLRDIENGKASFDDLAEEYSPCGATNQTCYQAGMDKAAAVDTACYEHCHAVFDDVDASPHDTVNGCTLAMCEDLFNYGDPDQIFYGGIGEVRRRRRLAKERRRLQVTERRRKLSEKQPASCMTSNGKEFCKTEEAVDPVQRRLDELEIRGYKYAMRVNTVPHSKRRLGVVAKNRNVVRAKRGGVSVHMTNGARKSHRGVKRGLRRMFKNGRKGTRKSRKVRRGRK